MLAGAPDQLEELGCPVSFAEQELYGKRRSSPPSIKKIKTAQSMAEAEGQEESAMKRIVYALLIAAAFAIPTEPQELDKLKAVEVIRIHRDADVFVIETDMGDYGKGSTIEEAIGNLKVTTPGTVYLDTAEYLLLSIEEEVWIQELKLHLKDSVRICQYEGEVDLEKAAEYLRVHQPLIRLGEYNRGVNCQLLVSKNDRLELK